ncbi:hypothetical protein GCM10011351_14680 [Paraliobacillus quinghaiensis]|uniref:TATA-box binding protein n=1 Tax=Paraliobacillus quinghaiensis TaxID=470815 RepID=A0A917TNL2_9BACI|nr:YwmB family TATA-box binding protein [Paraliobacillus quinghaiensis]GGM29616.1 hypothetical protein GCM10011351_14680 [Paraliobacillus quinghaiensis]
MIKKLNMKNWIVVFISMLILICFYGDNKVNAEEYKQDGLLLLDAFEGSNIKVDKTILNYNDVLKTYNQYSELTGLKTELERLFSIDLILTSETDNREVVKYEGKINIKNLPETAIQVGLVGVYHENDTYQAHIIIFLMSDHSNKETYIRSFNYLMNRLKKITIEPEIQVNIQGAINKNLNHKQQENVMQGIFEQLGGTTASGGVKEKNMISLTGYSSQLHSKIQSNEPINIQIASRYSSWNDRTTFTIGSPIISAEY